MSRWSPGVLLHRILNRILMWVSPSRRRHSLVGPPRLWRLKRDFQFGLLRDQGLRPGHQLLDIGCGTLRGGIPLIRYLEPGHYVGVDVRPEVLRAGWEEVEKHDLVGRAPLLLAGDVTRLALRRRFDVVWAFSVFIHLTDDQLEHCFRFVSDHLKPAGKCLGNVNLGRHPESSWRQFPVVTRPEAFYRRNATIAGLDVEVLGCLREFGHDSGVKAQDEQRLLKLTPAR